MSKKRRLSKKQLKEQMLQEYVKSNEKYSKLLKEIELNVDKDRNNKPINKIKYRSCVWKSNKQSKGEFIIENILLLKDIYFLKEVEFKNCTNPKTKKKLRFDFYLPNSSICIEYDGEQHFKQIKDFDGSDNGEALKKRKFLDSIKDDYCKNNNITLIRIKYTCKNIKKELSKILK